VLTGGGGGGVFICVKNYIDCRELWADEESETIAIEIKGKNPKSTWEIIGAYRAPNEDLRAIERLAVRTGDGSGTKRSIIGDLNLPNVDWRGNIGEYSEAQTLVNNLIWENDFRQVIDSPIRGDALLDVFLVRPESTVRHSEVLQGVSDHQAVILEVKWRDTYSNPQEERFIPIYNKTDIIGLQSFLREEYGWAGKGKNVEEIGKNFKNIVYEGIERFVPHKILRKNSDPEHYSKEIRILKRKVRKAYNRRSLGVPYKEKLKY
jgi:hypothetical protein